MLQQHYCALCWCWRSSNYSGFTSVTRTEARQLSPGSIGACLSMDDWSYSDMTTPTQSTNHHFLLSPTLDRNHRDNTIMTVITPNIYHNTISKYIGFLCIDFTHHKIDYYVKCDFWLLGTFHVMSLKLGFRHLGKLRFKRFNSYSNRQTDGEILLYCFWRERTRPSNARTYFLWT